MGRGEDGKDGQDRGLEVEVEVDGGRWWSAVGCLGG